MIASVIGRINKRLRYELGDGPSVTHAVLIGERDLHMPGLLLARPHVIAVALVVDMPMVAY